MDSDYFLVNYNGSVTFTSFNGNNFVNYSSVDGWSLFYYYVDRYIIVGHLKEKKLSAVGVKTLQITVDTNATNNPLEIKEKLFEIKITNVSFLK